MHECGFFKKSRRQTVGTSRFEARDESPMMRKCEFRMQENLKLFQGKFEKSETLGLGPKYSNLSLTHLNPNPLAKAQLLGPFKPKSMQARLEEAPASTIRRTPHRRGARLFSQPLAAALNAI